MEQTHAEIVIHQHWLEINQTNKLQIFIKTWTPASPIHSVPIILFHDSLGSVDLWRDFPEKLALCTQRQVIAYDRLGFGHSSAHPNILKNDFVISEAQDVFKQVLEKLKVKQFIAMGHSVGGGMAVASAACYTKRCIGLITMAAQSHVEELTLSGIRKAKAVFAQAGQLDRLKKYHGEKAQWVLDAWTETWLSNSFRHWTLQPYLQKVYCPILVIHGELDEYGSLNQPQQLIDYSQARSKKMYIMQNVHHMPHKEQPEDVLHAIIEFLDSISEN